MLNRYQLSVFSARQVVYNDLHAFSSVGYLPNLSTQN